MNELLFRPRHSKYLSDVEKIADEQIKNKVNGLFLKKMKFNVIFRILMPIINQDRLWFGV